LVTEWPEENKDQKQRKPENLDKNKVMPVLSKYVSHCLEQLELYEIFDGVRDISNIKRKMSKSHFKAL